MNWHFSIFGAIFRGKNSLDDLDTTYDTALEMRLDNLPPTDVDISGLDFVLFCFVAA